MHRDLIAAPARSKGNDLQSNRLSCKNRHRHQDTCQRSEGWTHASHNLRLRLKAPHQGGQQGLLGMEAVFGLIENSAGDTFHHLSADLFTPMGGQAMQHDG